MVCIYMLPSLINVIAILSMIAQKFAGNCSSEWWHQQRKACSTLLNCVILYAAKNTHEDNIIDASSLQLNTMAAVCSTEGIPCLA